MQICICLHSAKGLCTIAGLGSAYGNLLVLRSKVLLPWYSGENPRRHLTLGVLSLSLWSLIFVYSSHPIYGLQEKATMV